MDNLCHTLVGAALGEAGLKRQTRLGSATLMIASNLPDIDVLVFGTSTPSVAFRRGWTHGVLADVFLPLLLAGIIVLASRRRGGVRPMQILALSYLGVILHVLMDLLNNYGVRLLMPFSQTGSMATSSSSSTRGCGSCWVPASGSRGNGARRN